MIHIHCLDWAWCAAGAGAVALAQSGRLEGRDSDRVQNTEFIFALPGNSRRSLRRATNVVEARPEKEALGPASTRVACTGNTLPLG